MLTKAEVVSWRLTTVLVFTYAMLWTGHIDTRMQYGCQSYKIAPLLPQSNVILRMSVVLDRLALLHLTTGHIHNHV